MANDELRGCPTCGTPVTEVSLGLRDYRWVADALPGRVAPMDLDFMLEKNGRFLVLEYKPGVAPLPLGQRLTLKQLVRLGMDVWVVWHDDGNDTCKVGSMNRNGDVNFIEEMRVTKLRAKVRGWFEEASKDA